MGGRNKGSGSQFAAQYSIETVDFWLSDPRVMRLGVVAKCMLFYLGLVALKERRECLPAHWTVREISFLMESGGRAVGESWAHRGRDSGRAWQSLVSIELVDQTKEGRLIVCGARKRRPNLVWKDEGEIVGINGYTFHQAVSSKQEAVARPEGAEGGASVPKKKLKAFRDRDGRWLVKESEVA